MYSCVCVCPLRESICLRGWNDDTGMHTLFLCRQSSTHTVNDFSTSSRVMDNQNDRVGWELLATVFQWLVDGRSVHHSALVVLCTFSIWVLTLNVAPSANAMMDSPPGSFPCFKGVLKMGGVVGVGSGNRSPMSNGKLPNGSSTALHQGRWSWRGGCCRQMLKTASQATICTAGFPIWHEAYKPSSKLRHVSRDKARTTKGKPGGLGGSWLQTLKPKLSAPLSINHVELKPKASLQSTSLW